MHDWREIVRERVSTLHLNGAAELNLVEEIAQHLQDLYREYRSGGASEAEARQKALAELDDMYPLRKELKEKHHLSDYEPLPDGDTRPGSFLEDVWRDLRYTARTMHKSPVFVLFVVLTLALGIGANTTVFTIINTLILNPLPVPDASRLVTVGETKANSGTKANVLSALSYPDLQEYRVDNEAFRSMAGYTSPRTVTWQADAGSERLFAELVTGNYFSTLDIHPAKGRFFLPKEDSTPGAYAVAVMNYGTWQARFGGAEDIVGKTLRLNNAVYTVIGVAPPRFIGINAVMGPDLWIPSAMAESLFPNEMQGVFTDRSKAVFQAVGRLRPGIHRTQAQARVMTVAANLAREYPATHEGRTAAVWPIRDALYTSANSGSTPILFASTGLLIVVGIVLLIACSNVANLLMARAAARQQEIAIRLALGASRRRLIRQLLTESMVLGGLSGAVGFCFGYAGLHLLFGALPSAANFITPKFDATVFLFALLVSLVTSFLFGIIPALKTVGGSVADTLKEESRSAGRSRRKVTLASSLLVGQVAFSFLLLVTAALFLRSIGRAYKADPGFQTKHLAVFLTSPGQAGYRKPQTQAFYREVRERVARIPGVESLSWASNLPLWARAVSGLEIEGRQARSQADVRTTLVNTVDLNYFETAGVKMVSGRAFTNNDSENSSPVAIVNEKIAREDWPNGDVLGKRIRLSGEKQMRQIVGIARNASYTSWAEPPQRCVYVPLEQHYADAMILYVRSRNDPRDILTAVRREIHMAAPQVLANDLRTGREIVDGGLFQARMGVMLLTVFGLLALGLASIGLYGLVAYSVQQRKREIGIRMALGAAQGSVLSMVLKQGMSLVLTGVGIGLAAALFSGQMFKRMLYGIGASDPLSIGVAILVLLGIALLACYLPARRASRVDPLIALREG